MNRKGLIDKHLIQSSAYSHMEDFHVLVSPANMDSPRTNSLEYENLPSVLEACHHQLLLVIGTICVCRLNTISVKLKLGNER